MIASNFGTQPDPSITVTDEAREELQRLMTEHGEGDLGLRINIQPGGCAGFQYGLGFEKESGPDDQVLEANGVRVFINRGFVNMINGLSIDYQNDLLGSGFRIDNPNATGGCGCGRSFAA